MRIKPELAFERSTRQLKYQQKNHIYVFNGDIKLYRRTLKHKETSSNQIKLPFVGTSISNRVYTPCQVFPKYARYSNLHGIYIYRNKTRAGF